jgi:hypothetical protein
MHCVEPTQSSFMPERNTSGGRLQQLDLYNRFHGRARGGTAMSSSRPANPIQSPSIRAGRDPVHLRTTAEYHTEKKIAI